ncbi:hypothetical protein N7G274_002536 [Stereocaulon virgatum]|uniref:DUF4817 domain-containing protein n=1 Tax=Stereocaulon virgatum TaxID=373712 RepID=A0ABR4AIW1_9LECA
MRGYRKEAAPHLDPEFQFDMTAQLPPANRATPPTTPSLPSPTCVTPMASNLLFAYCAADTDLCTRRYTTSEGRAQRRFLRRYGFQYGGRTISQIPVSRL